MVTKTYLNPTYLPTYLPTYIPTYLPTYLPTAEFSAISHLQELYFRYTEFALQQMKHGWESLLETLCYMYLAGG